MNRHCTKCGRLFGDSGGAATRDRLETNYCKACVYTYGCTGKDDDFK